MDARARGVGAPLKHERAAGLVRGMIGDGTLKPGQVAPSGAQLARLTGYSVLTCRRALRDLIGDGTLARGASLGARPRVAATAALPAADAARALSRGLAALRRAAGLGQPGLAALTGYSVTAVGHAETGRLWQARAFWEKADLALAAGGELTRRYDAYRAALAAPAAEPAAGRRPLAVMPSSVAITAAGVLVTWPDGTKILATPPPSVPDTAPGPRPEGTGDA